MSKKTAPSQTTQNDQTGENNLPQGAPDGAMGGHSGPMAGAQELAIKKPKSLDRKKAKGQAQSASADDATDKPLAGAPDASVLLAMTATDSAPVC